MDVFEFFIGFPSWWKNIFHPIYGYCHHFELSDSIFQRFKQKIPIEYVKIQLNFETLTSIPPPTPKRTIREVSMSRPPSMSGPQSMFRPPSMSRPGHMSETGPMSETGLPSTTKAEVKKKGNNFNARFGDRNIETIVMKKTD